MIFDNLIPITDKVSVDPRFISLLSNLAIPNLLEFIAVVDKLTDEAFDEVYSSKKSCKENEIAVGIRYFQKLWNLILKKGNDNNV